MGILDRVRNKLRILGSSDAPAAVRPLPDVSLADGEPASTRGGRDVEGFIREKISENRVFLFMKGSPDAPRCGFSANVVSILGHHGVTYETFDVLSDDDVRSAVKQIASWPTFPQLFVDGALVGGSDIVSQLHQSGELAGVLQPRSS